MEPIITIQEDFVLPSKGKIYSEMFNPTVKLRSMTVAEEMKRLSITDNPYKTMCEIIDDCIIGGGLPVSSYDLCIGDYQYLLHKLRTVTYGPEYKVNTVCPKCGEAFEFTIDLDSLEVKYFDESIKDLMNITLSNGDLVKLKLQTPRDLDDIERKTKAYNKANKGKTDPSIMLNIETFIDTINGEKLTADDKRAYVTSMPMNDSIMLIDRATLLNLSVGVDIKINTECTNCGKDVTTNFRYTQEFFRPRVR